MTVFCNFSHWHSIVCRSSLVFLAVLATACGSRAPNTAEATTKQPAAPDSAGHVDGLVVLDSTAVRLGGIGTARAEPYTAIGLPVTGAITYDANRVSHIGARTQGRVVALRAELGARVTQGQVLALLESPEVGEIRTQEHEAEALVGIARENYAREQRLAEQGISSRKELLQAEAELRKAEASLRSAQERLRVLGAGHGTGGQFAVVAPFSGVVVARDASLGEMAGPEANLFTVADLSRVWIELDIFERDLARLNVGQAVSVGVAAFPGQTFSGRVVYLSAIVDTTKRTVRARVDLPNSNGALRPGMFAKGTIQVGVGGPVVAVIPEDAVQEIDKQRVVFVPGVTPGAYQAVPVELGETLDGGRVVIQRGIVPGRAVVTTGAFTLRAELQKEELAEGVE